MLVPAGGPKAVMGKFAGLTTQNCEDDQLFSTGETWNAS